MTKVVVFGGSGFLGSYLADELTKQKFDVVIADVEESKYINSQQSFVRCDIMDRDEVDTVTRDCAIVYNFAGQTNLDESIALPKETIEQNVIGNINILESIRELPIKRYVYASSAYAVSRNGSFYGISKLASEKIIEEYNRRYNLPYTIVRYGSLFGGRADRHNGIRRMIEEALTDKKITYPGDGEEVREYIHASDAAKLSVDIIQDSSYEGEHLILTGVERIKRRDLVYMIEEILGKKLIVEHSKDHWEGHYRITPYSFQPRVAKKLVPNPFVDLGQGITSCIESYYQKIDE